MVKDLVGSDDGILLVDTFYARIKEDELLAPVFMDRIGTYWSIRLSKMYNSMNTNL